MTLIDLMDKQRIAHQDILDMYEVLEECLKPKIGRKDVVAKLMNTIAHKRGEVGVMNTLIRSELLKRQKIKDKDNDNNEVTARIYKQIMGEDE